MPAYEIRPFDALCIAELGPFLTRSLEALSLGPGASGEDGLQSLNQSEATDDYRWLLDEGNPAQTEGIPAGEIIRNDQGAIVGMIGFHPLYFRYGDRRLLGLGAHNFFVDPTARMQGFMLFRRYLNNPKADFCFSTTCNTNSGPLWAKCGAVHLPDSDSEYLLVLRYGPVLKELAIKKGVPKAVASVLLLAGPPAGLVLRPRGKHSGLKCERCDDWERLSAIAERNRDPTRVTPERSAKVLQRRFDAMCRDARSSGSLDGIYRFTASSGHEGWFLISAKLRGSTGQVRGLDLLDVVWPRGSLEFSSVISAVIEVAGSRADVLSIRDRSAWGLHPGLLGARRRTFPAQEAFVYSRAGSGLPQPAELAPIADLPTAFGV
jgi:hypothetical protein